MRQYKGGLHGIRCQGNTRVLGVVWIMLLWAYVQLRFHQFLFMLCFWGLIMSTSLLILIMWSWQTWRSEFQSPTFIFTLYLCITTPFQDLEYTLSTSSEPFTHLRPPLFPRHLSKTPSFLRVTTFRSSRILQIPLQLPFSTHFLCPLLTPIIQLYSDTATVRLAIPFLPQSRACLEIPN